MESVANLEEHSGIGRGVYVQNLDFLVSQICCSPDLSGLQKWVYLSLNSQQLPRSDPTKMGTPHAFSVVVCNFLWERVSQH